ncbi:MAG: hypothetical protein FDZ69_01680 [Deltaproteobacteria bacterium]|nr:MAG: hypothetical protein FDZ69_01680 [Deltaproteobacteria bacterium]
MRLPILLLALLLVLPALSGCSGDNRFLKNLAKTDGDFVADAHLREMNRLLQGLMAKLYKRNPRELRKAPGITVEQRQWQIFSVPGRLVFPELDNRQGTQALDLAFDPTFDGDRVFAVMVGLTAMVRSSFNWQEEQFIIDSLDPQKFFDSARNLEILVWRLSNRRDDKGNLLLLTNACEGEEANLSFERQFGKMIAMQDMMAFILTSKLDRGISRLFQGALSSAAFLPMGF